MSNISVERAKSLLGFTTRGGVQIIAVVYGGLENKRVLGLEALCRCGKVWTITNAPSAAHPTRSCDECRKKRMRVHFALSAREEGWSR